jgi:hypothetical protein
MPTASGAPLRKESADGNLGVSSPRGRQVPFAPTSRAEFFRKLLEGLHPEDLSSGTAEANIDFTDVYGTGYHVKRAGVLNSSERLPNAILPGSEAPFERPLIPKGAIIKPGEPARKQ